MKELKFQTLAKKYVCQYVNRILDKSDKKTITEDDVYIVWMCYILGNNKALLSTTLNDGMYYEITYNADKKEMYIDAYKKWENMVINITDDGGD